MKIQGISIPRFVYVLPQKSNTKTFKDSFTQMKTTTNTKNLQRFKTQIATKQTQQSKPRCHGFGFGVVVPVVDGGGARGVWLWLN